MAMMTPTLILLVASMSTLVILVSGNNISRIFGPSRLLDDNTRKLPGIFKRQAGEKGFSESQKAEMLKLHNDRRRNEGAANMLEMTWDRDLEKFAQKYSEKCIFGHSSNAERMNIGTHKQAGENLYVSTGALSVEQIVTSWWNETHGYNFDTKGCSIEMCGHYTQLVWHESWALGCGVTRCSSIANIQGYNNGLLVDCVYAPPGNMIFNNVAQPIYTKGPPCSQCPANRVCKDKLCALPEGSRPPGQPGEPSSCEVVQAHLLISTIIMASQLLLLF